MNQDVFHEDCDDDIFVGKVKREKSRDSASARHSKIANLIILRKKSEKKEKQCL